MLIGAEFTLTGSVAGAVHWPGLGVKTMFVVVPPKPEGLKTGPTFQVPEMPFSELAGKGTGPAFSQNGPMGEKDGTTLAFIAIFIVATDAH